MRPLLVTLLLLALFAVFAATKLWPGQALALTQRALAPVGEWGRANAPSAAHEAAPAEKAPAQAPAAPKTPPAMRRPLRVVGLGADLLGPGLLAKAGGAGALGGLQVPVELTVVQTAAEIETALALGGEQPRGADVAVLPLPTFVASYERLRALDPTIFIVTGRSRGREALAPPPGVDLRRPLPDLGREVATLLAAPGSSEAFFGLAVLELAGISPESVRLLPPSDGAASPSAFEAVSLARPGGASLRRAAVSTADAAGLVPFVAVTPRGFLSRNQEALVEWAGAWLAATQVLLADVPAAARQIARVEEEGDPVALVGRLGSMQLATLRDNAALAGLSGRGAVTVDQLFAWSWRLWRSVGVLTTPAPEGSSFDPSVVTALVRRAERPPPAGPAARAQDPSALLASPGPRGAADDEQVIARVGLLAGIFERSDLALTVPGGPRRVEALLQKAADRYGLDRSRLSAGGARLDGRAYLVEVRAPR